MKISLTTIIAATLAVSLALPSFAQTPIPAPRGWTAQTKTKGARTFTPPDLKAGEVYGVTVYDSVAMNGATLDEWLRKFAGPVGAKAGALKAPLALSPKNGRVITGSGVYGGPKGSELGVIFLGVTIDGGSNVHAMRILFSSEAILTRYKPGQDALMKAMTKRANDEAGDNVLVVPDAVAALIKPGGELVPGVYAGNQYADGALRYRFRVYIYPNGEYRYTDQNDEDYKERFMDERVGNWSYNRNSGQLELYRYFDMANDSDGREYCYYGRDAAGKATIIAADTVLNRRTVLVYDGQPTKRPAPATIKAREAAAEAEKKRYKWTMAPGKGVADAQIAMLWSHYAVETYYGGTGGIGTNITDDNYLLLKDGTIHAGLPVAPDQLDVVRSRQNEPESWGKWRQVGGKMQVSWNGAPYQALLGEKAVPAPAQTRLAGRFGAGSSSANMLGGSYELWGVTFDKTGRFIKDGSGGSSFGAGVPGMTSVFTAHDDNGSATSATGESFVLSSQTKKQNPNGAREGDYSINGYVLTLRFDNGTVARLPFFFADAKRETIYFEGAHLSLDEKEKK